MEDASRYEVTETIATGEFAVVLRARDRKLDRDVVLKQIQQPYLAAERQLARYWKEMQLLAALRHPNLLTIYDIVQPKGFVVLELMRESLLPATQTAGIDLELVRAALSGCLTALEFLHAKGIRHGDVKPGNMLVDNEGRVKLADFGYFRHPLTQNGELLKGTPKYMAPELLSTQFGRAGAASDLYSLGFSAYELICGTRLEQMFAVLSNVHADKNVAWMMWHAAPQYILPPVNRVVENVPNDLVRVLQRLTSKDQVRRYQSAKDALRDLDSDPLVMTAKRRASEAAQAAEAAKKATAKRKRRICYATSLAAAMIVAICAAMFFPQTTAKTESPIGGP